MSMQARSDLNNNPFILAGVSFVKNDQTVLQDASRSTVLAKHTVMAKIAASGKWVPVNSMTATDGGSIAAGIYVGDDIAAADLVSGDVSGAAILVGGNFVYNSDMLVLENSLTLSSAFAASDATNVYFKQTLEDFLENKGMFAESTVDIAGYEN